MIEINDDDCSVVILNQLDQVGMRVECLCGTSVRRMDNSATLWNSPIFPSLAKTLLCHNWHHHILISSLLHTTGHCFSQLWVKPYSIQSLILILLYFVTDSWEPVSMKSVNVLHMLRRWAGGHSVADRWVFCCRINVGCQLKSFSTSDTSRDPMRSARSTLHSAAGQQFPALLRYVPI